MSDTDPWVTPAMIEAGVFRLRELHIGDPEASIVEAIYHAMHAERLAIGWRPMETAPKDGRDVILCGDPKRYGRPVRVDHWDEVNGCWFRSRYSSPPDTFIGWQSLPSPPRGLT